MDSPRNILLIAFVLVSFLLFQKWGTRNDEPVQVQNTTIQQQNSSEVPSVSSNQTNDDPLSTSTPTQLIGVENIHVKTDVLDIEINPLGGDIVSAKLVKYNAELNSKDPFVLLRKDPQHLYIAQSGFFNAKGPIDSQARYLASSTQFSLEQDQQELKVPLTFTKDGITYTKTFIFKPDSYTIDVTYDVNNKSGESISVGQYARLRQSMTTPDGNFAMPIFTGSAYSTSEKNYKKYKFDEMAEKNLNVPMQNGIGWIAMIQHYFASAWIPEQKADGENSELQTNSDNLIYSRVNNNQADIGYSTSYKIINSNSSDTFKAKLWLGPKLQNEMAATADNLDLVVDYGWLWFIAKPLHSLLAFIQTIVINWGIAIILLTFIVRGAMYPLTKAQYTSMAKMRMLQPKITAMRERLGDDRQRISAEMMQMYKDEKVNPLGGCFPIILQMPIFIALYWALMESVELRHQPFFLWINDLSAQDPYYILPILMGISMLIIQKMSPTTVTDPMQQKIMMFMPIVFIFFFLWFPSGLVLYYLMSNIVTLVQQTLIYRSLEKKGLHSKK